MQEWLLRSCELREQSRGLGVNYRRLIFHDDVCLEELADTEEALWNLVIDYIVLQS